MKEFLATWLIVQLLSIGFSGAKLVNGVRDGTYRCSDKSEKIPVLFSAMMPLVWFLDDPQEVTDYCRNPNNEITK